MARELSTRKIVVIDPGMNNLLTCSTVDGSEIIRHTKNQGRLETKCKKYRHIGEKEKRKVDVIEGRTDAEWEATLSEHNHKTVCAARFAGYIGAKLVVNSKMGGLYEWEIFGKLKLDSYFNEQRSLGQARKRWMHLVTGSNGGIANSKRRSRAKDGVGCSASMGTKWSLWMN